MEIACCNSECENYEKKILIVSVVYKFENGKLIPKCDITCPVCKQQMKEVENQISLKDKNIMINEFGSLSKEGKIESLKKRSHNHFEKKIKDRKKSLWNQIKN